MVRHSQRDRAEYRSVSRILGYSAVHVERRLLYKKAPFTFEAATTLPLTFSCGAQPHFALALVVVVGGGGGGVAKDIK